MSQSNYQKAVADVFDGMLRLQKKQTTVFGGADG